MAKMQPFGSTKIVEDVKARLEQMLVAENWGMTYSNIKEGFRFKRKQSWCNAMHVTAGECPGEIVVTREDESWDITIYHGDDVVEKASLHVMRATLGLHHD